MRSLLRDIRHGARALRPQPGLSGISVLAMALGIGVTTTMFSIVYGVLLRGLPFEDGQRIYSIARHDLTSGDRRTVPIHDYLDWRSQQTSFDELGALLNSTVNIAGTDGATRYEGARVTPSALRLLGVAPLLGRLFDDDDDSPGAEPTILIGHHVWRDRYGSDPGIVGDVIRVNGEQATVIGVMPEGFRFPVLHDVWLPLRIDAAAAPRAEGNRVRVVGLLSEHSSLTAARAELTGIAERLAREYPETNENAGVTIDPYTHAYVGNQPRAMLWTMLGAVSLVLLIACANVANLLVSRAFDRSKEVAIRTALGAGRLRVLRQTIIEAGLLAAAGAALGIAIAVVGVDWFNGGIAGTGAPFFIDIRVDGPILLFVVGATTLATLLAGTLPALQVMRSDLHEVLADAARGSSGFRLGRVSRVLVTGQVALSCMLLVGAGLMIRSVVNLGAIDYGFDPDALLTGQVNLFERDYVEIDDRALFLERLGRRLDDHPGVTSAALMSSLPVAEAQSRSFLVEGEAPGTVDEQRDANVTAISPGLFETFGVELVGGRDFTPADRRGELPVVIVNASFVALYLRGRDPLGARMELTPVGGDERLWHTVVGVAPDLFMDGPQNESPEGMYVPLAQSDARFWSIAVRPRADALAFAPELRREVAALDPDLPAFSLRTMRGFIRDQTWFYWVFGSLFAVFGGVALLLASVGLYGVMAFAVRRRTAEIGIRMALGADARGVLGLVMRQGLLQLGIGLAVGILLATALANLLEVLLFNVAPNDPVTFGAIVAALITTGLTATLIPARRAARTDPMIALGRP